MVTSLMRARRSGVLLCEDGRRLAFREVDVLDAAFDELREGDVVEFTVEGGPSSHRRPGAREVRVTPRVTAAGCRGGKLADEPPASIRGDPVSEASWHSFPASDPPAHMGLT